jgi:hypothetical protein
VFEADAGLLGKFGVEVFGEMVDATSLANAFDTNLSVGGLEKAGSEIVVQQFRELRARASARMCNPSADPIP